MEAPEKIHVQPNAHDKWFEGKIPSGLPNGLFVEYIRTDVFIEKATKWLMDNIQDYTDDGMGEHSFVLVQDLKEDFKKFMKGE